MTARLLLLLICFLPLANHAQLRISVESGAVFSGYNDVRVPNGDQQAGTLFSLSDDFSPVQPAPFIRAELSYLIKDRHMVELTAAPLTQKFENSTLERIDYAGETFTGSDIDGVYEFNTYRASYRYRIVAKPKVKFDLGASILVRDARIALVQGALEAEDTDLGVVPLVSFELDYAPTERLSFLLKGDALVGPQGRAEDIFGGILVHLSQDKLLLKTGYRFIEGGADVDQVYNFALIHFVSAGLVCWL